jgi:hypothetical protein
LRPDDQAAERGKWVFVVTFGTIPALAGTFFAFALDAAKVKTEIRRLKKSAQAMTLTLKQYKISQEYIEQISASTSVPLMLLTFIAVFNAVGYVVALFFATSEIRHELGGKNPTVADAVPEDLVWFAFMGKEACLFFAFTYLAMVVNNAADDLCTEVYLWPTEADNEGSMEAGEKEILAERLYRKIQIIAQATTFTGPKKRELRGSWRRLTAQKAGGITFEVLGVRWTPKLMVALLFSIGSALFGIFVQPSGAVSIPT